MLHLHLAPLRAKMLAAVCISLLFGLNSLYIEHLVYAHNHEHSHTHSHPHNHNELDAHEYHHCELVMCAKNLVSTQAPTVAPLPFFTSFFTISKVFTLRYLPEVQARSPPVH
ncbi:hypothetical protein ACPV5T_11230 [Vibrio astriarenae]